MQPDSSPEAIFDANAQQYRDVHNDNLSKLGFDSFYVSEMKVKLLHDAKLGAVKRILDVGCGDGGMVPYFQKYFPGAHITGVDISKESVKLAQAHQFSNAEFFHSDGDTLPFADASFDMVVLAGVLMHVPYARQPAYLREMHRVLEPGGIFALFEHNPANPVTRRLVKICPFDDHAVLNPVRKVKNMLSALNYTRLRNQYYLFFPRVWGFQYLVPFEKYLGWFPLGGQYFLTAKKQ